uniref:Thioredoxin-like protein AAED1-like n=1 Tax=Saccoglossus kowalevskii TaxID=10224 RepID=A0ABM0LY14_SACKO|nr:PREDICTED: thioredoxin-like protein AAED1-like [Saccoglossus kowalevskii]
MATIDRGATPSEGLTSVDMYVPAPEPSTPHIDYEIIAKMPVWDSNGIMIPLDHLYRNQKVIIVFIRNFLCYTAKEYVEDLAKIPPNYLWDANVRLVVIGCSEWKYIKAFKNETGFPYELYVDQEKNIFSALKLKNHSSVQGKTYAV